MFDAALPLRKGVFPAHPASLACSAWPKVVSRIGIRCAAWRIDLQLHATLRIRSHCTDPRRRDHAVTRSPAEKPRPHHATCTGRRIQAPRPDSRTGGAAKASVAQGANDEPASGYLNLHLMCRTGAALEAVGAGRNRRRRSAGCGCAETCALCRHWAGQAKVKSQFGQTDKDGGIWSHTWVLDGRDIQKDLDATPEIRFASPTKPKSDKKSFPVRRCPVWQAALILEQRSSLLLMKDGVLPGKILQFGASAELCLFLMYRIDPSLTL